MQRITVKRYLHSAAIARRRKTTLREREIERVNVDTTVQEKAIAFPTDARLYHPDSMNAAVSPVRIQYRILVVFIRPSFCPY